MGTPVANMGRMLQLTIKKTDDRFTVIKLTYIYICICSINANYTESSKHYARPQTAVARGLDLPTRGLAGRQTAAASKHSLCYFSLFSE